jgi:hypothetical protein
MVTRDTSPEFADHEASLPIKYIKQECGEHPACASLKRVDVRGDRRFQGRFSDVWVSARRK